MTRRVRRLIETVPDRRIFRRSEVIVYPDKRCARHRLWVVVKRCANVF